MSEGSFSTLHHNVPPWSQWNMIHIPCLHCSPGFSPLPFIKPAACQPHAKHLQSGIVSKMGRGSWQMCRAGSQTACWSLKNVGVERWPKRRVMGKLRQVKKRQAKLNKPGEDICTVHTAMRKSWQDFNVLWKSGLIWWQQLLVQL